VWAEQQERKDGPTRAVRSLGSRVYGLRSHRCRRSRTSPFVAPLRAHRGVEMGQCCSEPAANDLGRKYSARARNWEATGLVSLRDAKLKVGVCAWHGAPMAVALQPRPPRLNFK
jgi:hypothetical protein